MKTVLFLVAIALLSFLPAPAHAAPTPAIDPALKKAVTDAQVQLKKDEDALRSLRTKMQADYESSDDYKNAQAALEKASSDYKATTQPVVKELQSKPAYKAALEKKERAARELANLQQNNAASQEQLTTATNAVIVATSEVQGMESTALNTSAPVADAKSRQTKAAAELKALKNKFDDNLKNDKDYQDAQKLIDEDKKNLDTAKKALQTAIDANRANPQPRTPVAPRNSTPPPARSGGGYRGR